MHSTATHAEGIKKVSELIKDISRVKTIREFVWCASMPRVPSTGTRPADGSRRSFHLWPAP